MSLDFNDFVGRIKAEVTRTIKAQNKKAMRLQLIFRFEERTCTRDLIVSPQTKLEEFHTMIQACGNWLNYHLHSFQFVMDGTLVEAEPSYQINDDEDDLYEKKFPPIVSDDITLEQVFEDFPFMLYRYDYGDGWEINILYRGSYFQTQDRPLPFCLTGKGDWPPDDVGGESGFDHFLAVINNPQDEEYEHLSMWGKYQGYEKYNRARCNKRLNRWRDYQVEPDFD